ncbi:MAG: Crp/Fnr family transcriptional regulator [Pyrinomonadaceae bacterium]
MSKNLLTSPVENMEPLPLSIGSKNRLLAELLTTAEARDLIVPHLKVVTLERNHVLYEQGDKIDYVYFAVDSAVSSLVIMEDGTTLETLLVGNDGLVGISAILGSGISREWLWVLVAGTAIQLEAKYLDTLFLRNERALKSLLHFYRSTITQISHRCVCNTRHTVMDRLCCWLLMLHDRVGDSNLRLTQEIIASRLGARRAGITVAAGALQAMHAIEYRRGQLHILEREVLERMACECYTIMRDEFSFRAPSRTTKVIPISRYK